MQVDKNATEAGATAIDPVCGMTVEKAAARWTAGHEGQAYYFCSEGCRNKFVADPAAYLEGNRFGLPQAHAGHDHAGHGDHGHGHSQAAPQAAEVPKGTKWTCPMHPEIVRDGPGDCPICGMALEPMVPTGADSPNPERIDFTRRMWVSAALSLPLLVIAMGPMLGLPVRDWIGEPLAGWLELVLASPVVLWAALPFFRRFLKSLRNR
jgi:Cu+-exporting ATPase